MDGIQIQIGADVSGAIRDIPKVSKSLAQVEDQFASLIGTTGDFAKAIDELGKDGALSINFLQKQINDFTAAMANATNPADIQKFGSALEILKIKQQQLINTGLPAHLDNISHSSTGGVIATQRLSASILGLSNHLDVLPPELSGLTHGFDQLIQSFERVTQGTEGAGDKVAKFASILGQVGIGLAISVAIGLLADFVKSLFDGSAALKIATEDGARFANEIDRINQSIEDSKKNLDFIKGLSAINIDINFGQGFKGDLLKAEEGFTTLQDAAVNLQKNLADAQKIANEAFHSFQDGISDDARTITGAFSSLSKVPDDLTKDLSDADKKFIDNAKKTAAEVSKIQDQITENEKQQALQAANTRLLITDNARQTNSELQKLLDSRLAIIEEFTKKFAGIHDPFPDFLAKDLPLGKVNDKLLREGLDTTFKLFSKAFEDLFTRNKIDPGTIPIEIKFKPEIIGKTDLVRSIEDSFGDLSKEVQDGINKGIFTVPVEFTFPPEGNGKALKQLEDRIQELGKLLDNGDPRGILNISVKFNADKVDDSFIRDVQDQTQELSAQFGGRPLVFTVNAEGKIEPHIDAKKIRQTLENEINQALVGFATDTFENIGNLIGDAISGNDLKSTFQQFATILANALSNIGKSLIKAGAAMLVAKTALGNLFKNPAFSIAAGIALIALSRIIANGVNNTQAREKGGPVQKGFTYLVNEKGQEAFKKANGEVEMISGGTQLYKAQSSGTVIPASLAKILANQFGARKLESGGIVSRPTFALLGEGLNPEIVAPLSELPKWLGMTAQPATPSRVRVKGKDIFISQARQARSNDRLI